MLNALVGSAGLGPTVAALGEGIDLALANKESLVVGGELVMALAEATGAAGHPRRLRALGPVPADRRASGPGTVDRLVLTASGGPFRGRSADELRDGHARGGARAPDLGHGRQDHDRLGHADEQGPRADRGAPPVRRPVRPHRRGRAPAVDHPRARPPERRRVARAPGLPRHARADLLRAAPPRARRRAGAHARPGRARPADLRGARRGGVPVPAPRARGRRGRGHGAVRAERGERGGGARVPRRATCRSPASPR